MHATKRILERTFLLLLKEKWNPQNFCHDLKVRILKDNFEFKDVNFIDLNYGQI